MNISYYPIRYNILYIYIYIYIYIHKRGVFVYYNVVATHTHTGHTVFTLTWSFPAGFTWSLALVETTYPIVNMSYQFTQVINEEARAI